MQRNSTEATESSIPTLMLNLFIIKNINAITNFYNKVEFV